LFGFDYLIIARLNEIGVYGGFSSFFEPFNQLIENFSIVTFVFLLFYMRW